MALLLRWAAVAAATLAVAAAGSRQARPPLPLSTRGRDIVDATGAVVQLGCANWYGADQLDYVVGGLNFHSLAYIAGEIAALGFNCVRLPFGVQMVVDNPVLAAKTVTAEPALAGASALQAFDATVAALDAAGLMIILDNHVSRNDWCCSTSDGNGLWYTTEYNASVWRATWLAVAARYAGVAGVVGADLRNELRPAVVNGEALTPTWGDGNAATDWAAAATAMGAALAEVVPQWLIVVEGLNYATDLTGAAAHPIVLPQRNKLVYEAHNYVFDATFAQPYDTFAAALTAAWGYILNGTGALPPTPLWVGEIGTCHGNTTACVDGPVGLGLWWQYLHTYLAANALNWGYWAIDGTQSTGTGRTWGAEETYGILNMTWDGVANAPLLASLTSLLPQR